MAAAAYPCRHAGCGLERLASEEFDVALVDLSLPDAAGIEVVVRLHASFPALPLVVVTGLDDELTAARAVREGAQDYLVKGQTDGHLLAASHALCKRAPPSHRGATAPRRALPFAD